MMEGGDERVELLSLDNRHRQHPVPGRRILHNTYCKELRPLSTINKITIIVTEDVKIRANSPVTSRKSVVNEYEYVNNNRHFFHSIKVRSFETF